MTETPGDRIRKLLLRAENTLKNPSSPAPARAVRARRALEEARGIARDPDVPENVRELVERRLEALTGLEAAANEPAGPA